MNRPAWINAYVASQPSLGPQVVCDGNSMTAGTGASDAAHRYPDQLSVLLGGSWTVTNTGLGAATTAGRVIAAPTNIRANLNLKRSKNIAIEWEVTNDIYYWLIGVDPPSGARATSLNDVKANMTAWVALAHAYDFKVIVATIFSRSNAGMTAQNIADFRTQRALYNAWVLSGASGADAVVDLAAIPGMGADGDEAGPDFCGDLCHPGDSGYLKIATAFHPVVAAMT